jgi:hypothetical protein
LGEAFRKGGRAAWLNLPAMAALQTAMAVVVTIYYCWPPGSAILSRYAAWQHSGGVLFAAIATALAGGVLSEFSIVYFQNGGRWTLASAENMAFKWAFFFVSGAIVYEFYGWQAVWWGQGAAWSVLVPKVLLDQFGYTVFWSTPFNAILLRWQILGYSFRRLRAELNRNFVTERMLPLLVTNWLFWLPGVCLIYAMPTNLQSPLFIFATAIWGLLLPAVMRQEGSEAPAGDALREPALLVTPGDGEPSQT